MHTLRRIALALVIIGAINWGLIGIFQYDLVAGLFGGQDSALARLIYTLVGISGLICLSFYGNEESSEKTAGGQTHRPSYGTEAGEEFSIDPDYEAKYRDKPRD